MKGLLILLAAQPLACFTVYHPLIGFQDPVAIDPTYGNFTGAKVHVRCLPTSYIDGNDAERLCQQVEALLTNQGATVTTATSTRPPDQAAELYVDLTGRLVHQLDTVVSAILFVPTFSLVPMVHEETMAQDVIIRDQDGFMLAAQTWQARFVRYAGIGIWGANWLMDHTLRDESDQLTGNGPEKQFSTDYYRQLSQLLLNARNRQRVMRAGIP